MEESLQGEKTDKEEVLTDSEEQEYLDEQSEAINTATTITNSNLKELSSPQESLLNESFPASLPVPVESSSESSFADDERTPVLTEHKTSMFDVEMTDEDDIRSIPRQRHFSVAGRKAGLLRLFESQFFTPHMAVCYLHRYTSDPGIQYYLCQRLRDPKYHSDVEFLLPQLCHLVVMRSKEECGPLECFVIEFAASSLHAGSAVLWYLEGYLQDIQDDILLRARCVKLLQLAQRAVFREEMPKLNSVSQDSFIDELPDLGATLVGFGCILASVAAPQYVQPFKPLLLMEARKADALHMPLTMIDHSFGDLQIKAASERRRRCTRRHSDTFTQHLSLQTTGHSLKRFFSHALSSVPGLRSQPQVFDNSIPLTTTLFYEPEMQFVASLVDVSRRLCSVPKDQRLSALHAELSLIDYELPAQICIPLWCPDESCHDRIVRIDVDEAMILNSAERVPFVVFVEVIRGGEIKFEEIKAIDKSKEKSRSSSNKSTHSNSSLPIPPEEERDESGGGESAPEDTFVEKMHMAAVMLAQLAHQSTQPGADISSINAIKMRIISEMEVFERQRILGTLQSRSVSASCESLQILGTPSGLQRTVDDPSAAVLRENWQKKLGRIKSTSPFGHLTGWNLLPIIVKAGSDMRQEQLTGQLVREFQSIWRESSLDIWVKYYRVLVASADGGLVETVTDAISIHSIKKAVMNRNWSGVGAYPPAESVWSLRDHYIRQFGSPDSQQFLKARDAFVSSLAGYSLLCYLLAIKDRHNGNILIDKHGHLIHIDFGFMLSNSPGSVGFESSPFKLPAEYIELLGGLEGTAMNQFKRLFHAGFVALRKHSDRILTLVETMWCGRSELPCLYSGQATIDALRMRFQLGLASVDDFVGTLIASSANNVFTRLYDSFQYYANGVY